MTLTAHGTLLVTMAGSGQRFRDAGYQVPKYAIQAHGRPIFSWALQSLERFVLAGWSITFITQEQDAASSFIRQQCLMLKYHDFHIIELPKKTDGQATSALEAKRTLRNLSEPIAIYNIDTFVDPKYLDPAKFRGDGWIPCFPGTGEGWSFVRVDSKNRAQEIREKRRISPHATIGFYGFSSFEIFARAYQEYYGSRGLLERGERYVAPLYNQLLEWGAPVFIDVLPHESVFPLGTPAELGEFLAEDRATLPCT